MRLLVKNECAHQVTSHGICLTCKWFAGNQAIVQHLTLFCNLIALRTTRKGSEIELNVTVELLV